MKPLTIIQRVMLTIASCVLATLIIEYGFGISGELSDTVHRLEFAAAYLFCALQVSKLFFAENSLRFFFKNWLEFTLVFLMLFQLMVGMGLEATEEYSYLVKHATPVPLASISLGFVQCYFLAIAAIESTFFHKFLVKLQLKPVAMLVISFLTVITIGTLMLKLPKAAASGAALSWVDAFFTAVSAVCITGLTVVDTGTAFSALGQTIILILIQLGGLGIITFTAFMAIFSGEGLLGKEVGDINVLFSAESLNEVKTFLFRVIVITLSIEFAGAVILFNVFENISNPFLRVFYSVFHSVSAYCNAGFSLWSESISAYAGNLKVMAVFFTLILLGSVGYPVLIAIPSFIGKYAKGKSYKTPIHVKTVLKVNIILIVLGSILFYFFESDGIMQGLSEGQKLLTSMFMPITTRTCGLQTLDISSLGISAVLLCSALMFIGGSPASSAGGVKTATIAVIFTHIKSKIFRRKQIPQHSLESTLISKTIKKAYLIFAALFSSMIICAFLIWLIENKTFDKILFEAVSATATVGLSMNVTAGLQTLSKILLTICMLIGRIAPAFIIIAINNRMREKEKIILG